MEQQSAETNLPPQWCKGKTGTRIMLDPPPRRSWLYPPVPWIADDMAVMLQVTIVSFSWKGFSVATVLE